mgnify:CR=1 FL=1
MKFALALILSLFFVDSVLGCSPARCRPGYYYKCEKPKTTSEPKFGLRHPCYFLRGCKCVKREGYDDLIKIKDIKKEIISDK